jgi:hypothetical protein
MKNPVTPGWRVEDDSRTKVKDMARAAGVSPSQFLDALIANVEKDERGLPVWWTVDVKKNEELPIDSD